MTFAGRFMESVADRKVVYKNGHRLALPHLSLNSNEIASRALYYYSIEIPVYRKLCINLLLSISNIIVLYLLMHIDIVTS